VLWLKPVIPVYSGGKIVRVVDPVQLRQKVCKTPTHPMAGEVIQVCHPSYKGKHKLEIQASPGIKQDPNSKLTQKGLAKWLK
jgi:hypothetical protein